MDYPSALHIGLAVSRLRAERSLSKKSLAANSNISACYLLSIEKGQRNPTWMILCSLAKAFGIPMRVFIRVIEEEGIVSAEVARMRSRLESSVTQTNAEMQRYSVPNTAWRT